MHVKDSEKIILEGTNKLVSKGAISLFKDNMPIGMLDAYFDLNELPEEFIKEDDIANKLLQLNIRLEIGEGK